MSTRKIFEVSPRGESTLYRFLKFLAEDKKMDFEFVHQGEFTDEVKKEAYAILVDPSLSSGLLKKIAVQPAQVQSLQSLDSFFKSENSWYPRLLTFEALRRVFVERARDLDIRRPAFVVAQGAMTRILASVLTQVGFADIYLIGSDSDDLAREQKYLSSTHLGIRFTQIPTSELTMQSVSAAVMINAMDLASDQDLMNDLSYFNFMKGEGYILDLNLENEDSPFIEEARNAELRVIEHLWIVTAMVQQWMEWLGWLPSIKVEEIEEAWLRFLRENSPSV